MLLFQFEGTTRIDDGSTNMNIGDEICEADIFSTLQLQEVRLYIQNLYHFMVPRKEEIYKRITYKQIIDDRLKKEVQEGQRH